jgi:valyl-tRNA synthetase
MEMNETIIIKKNKLVLLSKLLKDVKNIFKEIKGKELLTYKYNVQRKMIETLFDDEVIDKYIDNLKHKVYTNDIKKQAQKLNNETNEEEQRR